MVQLQTGKELVTAAEAGLRAVVAQVILLEPSEKVAAYAALRAFLESVAMDLKVLAACEEALQEFEADPELLRALRVELWADELELAAGAESARVPRSQSETGTASPTAGVRQP
jgi:hypothetical protein